MGVWSNCEQENITCKRLKEMLLALSLGLDCDQVSGDQVASQRSVHSPVTGMSYPRTIESLSDAHRAPKLDP